ncbi:MAG: mechanosensitive ion channel family protein [Alphaproteobacteria bacterium]
MDETLPHNLNFANLELLWSSSLLWLFENLLNQNSLYQIIILIAALFFTSVVTRLFRPTIRKKIEKSALPFRYKRIAFNVLKLLFPTIALITIFVMSKIIATKAPDINLWLTTGVTKVLFAWVGIRLMAQLINNNAVRNIMSMTIWVVAALSIFGLLSQTIELLNGIGFSIGDFNLSLFVVLKGAFYLFVLVYFATFVSSIADRQVAKSGALTRASKVLISKIMRIVLIGIALILGLTASGIDLSLFAVFGGAIGLGVGFGLQRGVSNLFSGMMLLLDRSIEPGDVIELEGGTFGWVEKMGARYTEIVSRDNKTYLIPNEELVTQRVVNWSHGDDEIRIHVDFGVHYKSDVHKVIEIAKAAAITPKRVLDNHEPVCWITEFGDSSVNFSLRFWIKDAQNGLTNVKGEVFLALWDAFKEHGIEIPYPHREVYMHTVKD